MDIATPEARETMAKQLETVAARLREAEGILISIEMKHERPMLIDDELMRMRYTGEYRFQCDLSIQFQGGNWVDYGKDTDK